MDAVSNLALTSEHGWARGLRLYGTVFIIGLLTKFVFILLSAMFDIISKRMVLSVAGALCVIEFLADKISYVDIAWDSIQTFIRIPAGALLSMGAINTRESTIASNADLLEGSLAEATAITRAFGWLFSAPSCVCWFIVRIYCHEVFVFTKAVAQHESNVG